MECFSIPLPYFLDRNDAAKYGVLEDYVFEEDCIEFTKVVRAYVDKENPENFSKFQVCSLTCQLEENLEISKIHNRYINVHINV